MPVRVDVPANEDNPCDPSPDVNGKAICHKRSTFRRAHRGQAIIVVALVTVFALIGITAVGVDGANYALRRRALQHAADSAALAAVESLRHGGTVSDAYNAAADYAITNTGPYTVTVPALGSAEGTGIDLTNGVEISTTNPREARVALVQDIPGFFTGILGLNSLEVHAQAHAIAGPPGGLLPITVKRFDAGRTDRSLVNGETRIDYMAQQDSGHNVISAWPSPLYAQPAHPASEDEPGAETAMVGSRALANDPSPSNSFRFFVSPDVRQITYPWGPVFYHGVSPTNSVQQLKGLEAGWVTNYGGWMSDVSNPYPARGEQLGTFDGANTGSIVDAIESVYSIGDKVTVMIYDGTVHRDPDFAMNISPTSQTLGNGTVSYDVDLWSDQGNFYSAVDPGTTVQVVGLSSEYQWWFDGGSHQSPHAVYIQSTNTSSNPIRVTLTISRTATAHAADVRGFTVLGWDAGTGKVHEVGATVDSRGNPPAYDTNDVDYSFFSPSSMQVIARGDTSASWNLDFWGFNGYGGSSGQDISYSATSLDPRLTAAGVTASAGSVTIKNNGGNIHKTGALFLHNTQNLALASAADPYLITVTATDGNNSHTWDLQLIVKPSVGGGSFANTTDFVYVLGYARFKITSFTTQGNSKTVYGRAVSGLYADPSQLFDALESRLAPWD